jgi:cobalt-zinc-cadmium efflux system outer membrane protein
MKYDTDRELEETVQVLEHKRTNERHLIRRSAVKYVLIWALLGTAGTVSSQQQTNGSSASFSANSTIADYLEYAFKNNRTMKAAEMTHKSTAEHAKQAGWISNPEISYEHMLEQHDMQYRIGLTQKIPGFGKLRLRKNIAKSHSEAAKYDSDTVKLMIFERVIKSFYNYHYLGRVTEITDENITLLNELEKVLLSRYKASSAGYSDLLKVQVERDSLVNHRQSLEDMRSVKSAALCAILNISTETILPWPKATRSGDTTLSRDVLSDMLETLNPELKALDSITAGLSMSEKLAKRNYLPDFVIGAGYSLMPEPDVGPTPTDTGLMIGISLPLWFGKNRSALREASFSRKANVHKRKQLENDLLVDLRRSLFDLNDADRQIELLNSSLIPKAQQAFDVAKKEFTNSKTPFMTLIDAQRTLFDLDLTLARAKADREIALGEIGCCVGKYDLNALEGKNSEEQ